MNECNEGACFFMGVLVASFFWGLIAIRITIDVIYDKAKKHGAGEYYLDANDIKRWRWTGRS
jgi:hypothetical protein